MSWLDTSGMSRSIVCCGEQVKLYRKQAQVTQDELASAANLTSRVIRKAEASKTLHADTIEKIAQALTTLGCPVFPEDLVVSPVQIAEAWLQAYRTHERDLTKELLPYLDENIECFVAGDPALIPIAGKWSRLDGFEKLWHTFFDAFDRPDKTCYAPKCSSDGVIAQTLGFEKIRVRSTGVEAGSWVLMRFRVRRGRLIGLEDYFDTHATVLAFD